MLKSVIAKEYDEKDIKDCDLDKLQSYIKCQKLDSALKITRHGIKTKSWVGIIKYKNLHLEILPKLISANDDRSTILKNLIFMLSYTKKLDIKGLYVTVVVLKSLSRVFVVKEWDISNWQRRWLISGI